MKKRKPWLRYVAAGLCSSLPLACHAVGGSMELAMKATTKDYVVEMGESTVTAMTGSGTLTFTRGSGKPFDDGASATVRYVGFSKTQPSGLELEADAVATFSPDDTLLLLFQRSAEDNGTSGEGNLQLTGGTGRFTGISGHCRYKMEIVSEDASTTVARCEWLHSFPYR